MNLSKTLDSLLQTQVTNSGLAVISINFVQLFPASFCLRIPFSFILEEISCNNRIKVYLIFLCAYRPQKLGGTAENIILSGNFNMHKKK